MIFSRQRRCKLCKKRLPKYKKLWCGSVKNKEGCAYFIYRKGVDISTEKRRKRCVCKKSIKGSSRYCHSCSTKSRWLKRVAKIKYHINYYLKNRERYSKQHKKWYKEKGHIIAKKNYRKRRPKKLLYAKIKREKDRKEIIKMLGNKCKKCGFEDWRALQIDHVYGGGVQEIKQGKRPRTLSRYKQKIERNPKNYQLLCANCNWIKRYENNETTSPKKRKE